MFLDLNGYELNCKNEILYTEIMNTAKGKLKKEELAKFHEKNSKKKDK